MKTISSFLLNTVCALSCVPAIASLAKMSVAKSALAHSEVPEILTFE